MNSLGIRGEKFKTFLINTLSHSNLKPFYINYILNDSALKMYDMVFTHKSVDPINNYEFYEFLGDSIIQSIVTCYLINRFPQLQNPDAITILTRLRSNLISKRALANMAKKLHFWDFVSVNFDIRKKNMDQTLEDIFEAFIGYTHCLFDHEYIAGVGYRICYDFISNILNTIQISLKFEDLFDAKTRLKEIFDHFNNKNLRELRYESTYNNNLHEVNIFGFVNNQSIKLGNGSANLKSDAEQKSALIAIEKLETMGFIKPINPIYKKYCY